MMEIAKKSYDFKRFKGSGGGTLTLAQLIEQANPRSREVILEKLRAWDLEFYYEVVERIVYFDELIYLEPGILAEILAATPAKVVAYAVYGAEDSFQSTILKFLGHVERRKMKDEMDQMGEKVSLWLIEGAKKQILKIARSLETSDRIQLVIEDSPRIKNLVQKKPKKTANTAAVVPVQSGQMDIFRLRKL